MIYENEVKLVDFVKRFVPHNYTVNLYVSRRLIGGTEWKRLWKGMDWQIAEDYIDSDYFKVHNDVLPCPYAECNVLGICGLKTFPDVTDEVSIVLDKEWDA